MPNGDVNEMAGRIEQNVARIVGILTVWARHMAARYNGPVYLLGSVLHNPDPRDIDVRIVVADHEFAGRYGNGLQRVEFDEGHHYRKRTGITAANVVDWANGGPTQRWIDDVAKFNSVFSGKHQLNTDIQVVPESWWVDVYPTPILLAEPSGRWFIYNAHVPDPSLPNAEATP